MLFQVIRLTWLLLLLPLPFLLLLLRVAGGGRLVLVAVVVVSCCDVAPSAALEATAAKTSSGIAISRWNFPAKSIFNLDVSKAISTTERDRDLVVLL